MKELSHVLGCRWPSDVWMFDDQTKVQRLCVLANHLQEAVGQLEREFWRMIEPGMFGSFFGPICLGLQRGSEFRHF